MHSELELYAVACCCIVNGAIMTLDPRRHALLDVGFSNVTSRLHDLHVWMDDLFERDIIQYAQTNRTDLTEKRELGSSAWHF